VNDPKFQFKKSLESQYLKFQIQVNSTSSIFYKGMFTSQVALFLNINSSIIHRASQNLWTSPRITLITPKENFQIIPLKNSLKIQGFDKKIKSWKRILNESWIYATGHPAQEKLSLRNSEINNIFSWVYKSKDSKTLKSIKKMEKPWCAQQLLKSSAWFIWKLLHFPSFSKCHIMVNLTFFFKKFCCISINRKLLIFKKFSKEKLIFL
jgi:hypothetical protein